MVSEFEFPGLVFNWQLPQIPKTYSPFTIYMSLLRQIEITEPLTIFGCQFITQFGWLFENIRLYSSFTFRSTYPGTGWAFVLALLFPESIVILDNG